MSSPEWPSAIESLNDYCRNSFNLPADNSLISPIARVVLQKRRLLKIQEIHNLLLEVSSEPSESLAQGIYEKEFLMKFRPTFSSVRWNELSGCEAQALSNLIVDTLLRCQADSQLINAYIKEAVAEIQGPDFKTRSAALRSSLILIRCIFKAFPKQAAGWSNDLLKSILQNFKLSNGTEKCFDHVLEGLKCLQLILRLPTKFTEAKEREKIPSVISKYLKANSTFIAIESAKVYEAYFETLESITKNDIKTILEHLNGGLSFRLQEYKCSARLLEFCLELKSEKGDFYFTSFEKNMERIKRFSYIDPRLLSDALANFLLRKSEEEAFNILFLLLPYKGSKTFLSAKCFAKTIELFVERSLVYNDSVKIIRFVFEKILLEQLQYFHDDYSIELIDTLSRLYLKFPESLTENDFTSFIPLTRSNDFLQLKAVELITTVLKDCPMILCSQVTLIFAQLKGDFLRLKLNEKTVIKDAVKGLLKLFAKVLKISLGIYSNYSDHEMILKIKDWTINQLKINEENDWLINHSELVRGLLLIAAVLSGENFEIASVVVEFMNNSNNPKCLHSLLGYFLNLITTDQDKYKLFFGSIEKCLHELNNQNYFMLPCGSKLFPLMKIIVESKKSEFNTPAVVCFIVRTIVFSEYFGNHSNRSDFDLLETSTKETIKLPQFLEYFAKMFWRSSEQTQDFCMTLMLSSLKNKTAIIPTQILQTIRAILECSEIKIGNHEQKTLLISQIQAIVKEFLFDDNFDVRLECGIVLGSIARLLDQTDVKAINDLFEQSMKHAMKTTGSKEQKSRVCYIMGIVILKANLESDHVKAIQLTSNALIGLIASWNRENHFETKGVEKEIAAASIFALAHFIEKCGCFVNSEFYRDSCELILEQVLMRDRNELMVKSVKELAKSLALYVNLLPCQSQFIMKTVRLLLESSYLSYYGNDCIDLLVEISEFNPQITVPSALIYSLLKRNLAYHTRGSFGRICQYLNLQITFNPSISFDLIDSGLIIHLLERANNPECFDKVEYESLSFLVKQLINLTLVERFDFWIEFIFEPLTLSGGERVNFKVSAKEDLSNSAFSLTDLREISKPSLSLRPSTILMLIGPLSQNVGKLVGIEKIKRFLTFAIRICFNISAEKSTERKFYLTGIFLFRGIVRNFSTILDENGISILEPFDSQIVSIISSALRYSEDGDPLYAACSFGSLFSLVSSRKDVQEDLKTGSGRVFNLLKKAITVLKEEQVFWTVEIVENLILLSIIVGFCSLQKNGFDLDCLDSDLFSVLKKDIGECFVAYKNGKLEKNIRASLSGQDRLLLIETWLSGNIFKVDSMEIDGIIYVLIGMNSENMDQVCNLSAKLFNLKVIETASADCLTQLLHQISAFGLERNDPLAIESILPLIDNEKFGSLAIEFINKLSNEFLSSRFNDFDTQYGLTAVKAQVALISTDQSTLFGILKKLIDSCLNDLEVNNCKEMLKALKAIFTNPKVSIEKSNNLLINWIDRLEEVDSIFLNQLVFFSLSSHPQIWTEETFKGLKKHFEKLLKSVNNLEMALDSWILLLKAQSKQFNDENLNFNDFVNVCTDQVKVAFEKCRGDGIDPVWERIFGMVQNICNSSEKEMLKVSELSSKALEELNDFK